MRTPRWRVSCKRTRSTSVSRPRLIAALHAIRLTVEQKGTDMHAVLAIATIAIPLAAGRPAPPVDVQPRPASVSFTVAQDAGQSAPSTWDGRWEGTTVSGQPLVLEIQVKDQHLTGRLTVGKQSANITEGKALDLAFALTTGPIDGHKVAATCRRVGDTIELTIEGVKEPLTLTRAQ